MAGVKPAIFVSRDIIGEDGRRHDVGAVFAVV
jgi:hypothetical protein